MNTKPVLTASTALTILCAGVLALGGWSAGIAVAGDFGTVTVGGITLTRTAPPSSSDPVMTREYFRIIGVDPTPPLVSTHEPAPDASPLKISQNWSYFPLEYLGTPLPSLHGTNPVVRVDLWSFTQGWLTEGVHYSFTYDQYEGEISLNGPAGEHWVYVWVDRDGDGYPTGLYDFQWVNTLTLPVTWGMWMAKIIPILEPVSSYEQYEGGFCDNPDGVTVPPGDTDIVWESFPDQWAVETTVVYTDQQDCSTTANAYEEFEYGPTTTQATVDLWPDSEVRLGVDILGGSSVYGYPIYIGLPRTYYTDDYGSWLGNGGYVRTTEAGSPSLQISKSAPSTVQTGQNLTYTITYGNSGNGDASAVVIRDTVPSGTTFVSATNNGSFSSGRVTWNLGTLAAGVTGQTVRFTVRVDASSGTIVNSTYSIQASGVSPVSGSQVTTTVQQEQTPTGQTCTLIDFEGFSQGASIGTVTGNPNVSFGNSWLALIDGDVVCDDFGCGNFANEPSPDTIAFFLEETDPIDFDQGVQFVELYYSASAISVPVTLRAWSGPSGTGQLIDQELGNTIGNSNDGAPCSGDPTGDWCLWDKITLTSTTDNIRSVTIAGAVANQFGFDNMSFCLGTPVEGRPEQTVVDPAGSVGKDIGSASDRDGNRVIVWKQTGGRVKAVDGNIAPTTDVGGVFARFFSPDDTPEGSVITVDTAAGEDVNNPTVSFDVGGDFVVGWERTAGTGAIFGRRFSEDLAPQGGAFQINDTAGTPEKPEVASSSSGDFAMVWAQESPKSLAGASIFARFFDADGVPKGTSEQVDLGTADEISEPSVASDSTGKVSVVWHQALLPKTSVQGPGDGVFARFFDPDGTATSTATKVNDDPTGEAVDPSVGSDAVGNRVVVWSQDSAAGAGFDVFARRFDANGNPSGGQFRVNSVTAGDQGLPSVAVNPAGDFAVAWESVSSPKKTLQGAESVFARFFDASGEPLGPEFEVAEAEAGLEPTFPEVEVSNADEVTVAYTKVDATGQGAGAFFRTFTVESPPGVCSEDGQNLCLNQERFEVRIAWRDFVGQTGVGRAQPVTDDTGYFWFFNSDNVEVMIKVLDGTWFNDYYWVFFASLSNVEYTITVTDTVTGGTATYFNPMNNFASMGDTEALPGDGNSAKALHRYVEVPPTDSSAEIASMYTELMHLETPQRAIAKVLQNCTPNSTSLCLNQERFRVRVSWTDFEGGTGQGFAVPLTDDTGYFWFFGEANIEVVIKVLDGTAINNHFWVFYGALSNVGYTITVTDTATGAVKSYTNPVGDWGSTGDTTAFPVP